MSVEAEAPAPEPVEAFRVVRGQVTAEETAILTVLFAALAGGATAQAAPTRRGWTQRARMFNPGAVRGSGWGGGL